MSRRGPRRLATRWWSPRNWAAFSISSSRGRRSDMSVNTIEKPPLAQLAEQPAEKKAEQAEKLVIFAWSGELDKIWPTLILATTGAAMGKETTVFFTFWGLFPLVKNQVRITGENWMQKMLSLMNRGGDEHLTVSYTHLTLPTN